MTTRQEGDARVIAVRGKGTVTCIKGEASSTVVIWDGQVRILEPAGGGPGHITIRASRIERRQADR